MKKNEVFVLTKEELLKLGVDECKISEILKPVDNEVIALKSLEDIEKIANSDILYGEEIMVECMYIIRDIVNNSDEDYVNIDYLFNRDKFDIYLAENIINFSHKESTGFCTVTYEVTLENMIDLIKSNISNDTMFIDHLTN